MAELVKYLSWFLTPLGLWLWLSALAASGYAGRGRLRAGLLIFANVQLFLFSLPIVSDRLLLAPLEREALALQQAAPLKGSVDAIVVLGGGMESAYAGVRELPDLRDAADRVWTGARLYRQQVAPRVVLSGGGFSKDPQAEVEAVGMARFMMDLGVPDEVILKETQSRTTLENAVYTKRVLRSQSKELQTRQPRIALVTSAFHMTRSVEHFEKEGFLVFPVRADIRVTPESKPLFQWLPRPDALDNSTAALKEYLGRLQRFVREWFKRV